jgi:hypothetical protein
VSSLGCVRGIDVIVIRHRPNVGKAGHTAWQVAAAGSRQPAPNIGSGWHNNAGVGGDDPPVSLQRERRRLALEAQASQRNKGGRWRNREGRRRAAERVEVERMAREAFAWRPCSGRGETRSHPQPRTPAQARERTRLGKRRESTEGCFPQSKPGPLGQGNRAT